MRYIRLNASNFKSELQLADEAPNASHVTAHGRVGYPPGSRVGGPMLGDLRALWLGGWALGEVGMCDRAPLVFLVRG